MKVSVLKVLKRYIENCLKLETYLWIKEGCQINCKNTKNHNKYYYAGLVLLYFKVWVSPSDALSFLQRISGACFIVTRIVFNEYQRPKAKDQWPKTLSTLALVFRFINVKIEPKPAEELEDQNLKTKIQMPKNKVQIPNL